MLGNGPTVLALQRRQHPQHQIRGVPQRLIAHEPRLDTVQHRAERLTPPNRIYAMSRGHRSEFVVRHKHRMLARWPRRSPATRRRSQPHRPRRSPSVSLTDLVVRGGGVGPARRGDHRSTRSDMTPAEQRLLVRCHCRSERGPVMRVRQDCCRGAGGVEQIRQGRAGLGRRANPGRPDAYAAPKTGTTSTRPVILAQVPRECDQRQLKIRHFGH